jgi:hypothetical protein
VYKGDIETDMKQHGVAATGGSWFQSQAALYAILTQGIRSFPPSLHSNSLMVPSNRQRQTHSKSLHIIHYHLSIIFALYNVWS